MVQTVKIDRRTTAGVAKRKIQSGEQFLQLFVDFVEYIELSNFDKLPSKREFQKFLHVNKSIDVDYSTIMTCLTEYYPDAKAVVTELQADTLAAGANKQRYNVTAAIFILKNWCLWSDRRETTDIKKTVPIADKAQASKALAEYADNYKAGKITAIK